MNNKVETFENIQSQKMDKADSAFILFTVKFWMKSHFDVFQDYTGPNFGLKEGSVSTSILRTFYSPDKLKIICWVMDSTPNNPDCNNKQGYYYSSTAVVGFRDSLYKKWQLYPLNNMSASCFSSTDKILNQMGQYYFTKMKEHSEEVNKNFLDPSFGGEVRHDLEQQQKAQGIYCESCPFILKNYGYNLQDRDFWNKSLIWQKGARIPGLYDFQTNGSVTIDDVNALRIPPHIDYPEEILKMFK